MKIKKGDMVMIMKGKDRGKTGKVIKAVPKEGKVFVEKLNMQSKHQKQTQKARAEIKHQEGPINVANVMYFDEKKKVASRIGYKEDQGVKVRFLKKTGDIID